MIVGKIPLLKNCPFCGEPAALHVAPVTKEGKRHGWLGCDKCEIHVFRTWNTTPTQKELEEVVEVWNKRTTLIGTNIKRLVGGSK